MIKYCNERLYSISYLTYFIISQVGMMHVIVINNSHTYLYNGYFLESLSNIELLVQASSMDSNCTIIYTNYYVLTIIYTAHMNYREDSLSLSIYLFNSIAEIMIMMKHLVTLVACQ